MSEVPVKELGNPGFSLSHFLYDCECHSAPEIPDFPKIVAKRVISTGSWRGDDENSNQPMPSDTI